jgi:transcriptional regulator with XRE-family HTH domain
VIALEHPIGQTVVEAALPPERAAVGCLRLHDGRKGAPVGRHWVDAFDRQRLERLRKGRGLSQGEVAERLYEIEARRKPAEKVDPIAAARRIRTLVVQVSFYESGRHRPRAETLGDLAEALGVDVLDLLEEGTVPTLATLRARLGLTQGQLAEKLGMSRGLWGHVEQGRRDVSTDEVRTLAKILKVSQAKVREAIAASRDQVSA